MLIDAVEAYAAIIVAVITCVAIILGVELIMDLVAVVDLDLIHGGQFFGYYCYLDSVDSDLADSAVAGLSNKKVADYNF